jgi:hypothetical protein
VAAAAGKAETDLIEFLDGCNPLILDSQYDRVEHPGHVGWGHGCLDDSVSLALRAGFAVWCSSTTIPITTTERSTQWWRKPAG